MSTPVSVGLSVRLAPRSITWGLGLPHAGAYLILRVIIAAYQLSLGRTFASASPHLAGVDHALNSKLICVCC